MRKSIQQRDRAKTRRANQKLALKRLWDGMPRRQKANIIREYGRGRRGVFSRFLGASAS